MTRTKAHANIESALVPASLCRGVWPALPTREMLLPCALLPMARCKGRQEFVLERHGKAAIRGAERECLLKAAVRTNAGHSSLQSYRSFQVTDILTKNVGSQAFQ